MNTYFPERGDIVWLDYNPKLGKLGHEQAGKRPAIVISPKEYNQKVGLALFFPVSSKTKNYPFEVAINLTKIKGVILADQIKSLDWKARKIKYIESAPSEIIEEVKVKLGWLID